ncbi:MAG: DUF1836 domain-containing protein [Lachnospiraceae bacterium]|nr:DUF1836 domain-containing protein [Lachnospiraceae bacterium]
MPIQMDDFIRTILKDLETANYIKPEEIPSIELYMDQVTTFMDSHLSSSKRNAEDKILTKTMINNYAKNNLLPPPVKKKYSRDHILMMIFIYYFKGFLSISDIQSLLNPLAENHFEEKSELPLKMLYEQLFSLEKDQLAILRKDLVQKHHIAKASFEGEKDKDFLQCFTLISMLSFDVYMKKQIIEKMIDRLLPKVSPEDTKSAKKTNAKAAKKTKEEK